MLIRALLLALAVTSSLFFFGWLAFWLSYFAAFGTLPVGFSWCQYAAGAFVFIIQFAAAVFFRIWYGDR